MKNIILISNPKKSVCADQVLTNAGYKIESGWIDNNQFSKDGKQFKLSHPIWNKEQVRISEIN